MKNSNRLKRIYEMKFGYHSEMKEYTTLMSDMGKLSEMVMW